MKEQEYDTENVTVQIVELSTDEIAKSNNWIGAKRPFYEDDQSSDEENDSNDDDEEEQIPGFTVTSMKPKKSKKPSKKPMAEHTADDVADSDAANDDNNSKKKKFKPIPEDIKSKRALGQFFAKRATNTLKHSKAIQMKNKLERNKSRKKARIEKEKKIKLQNKREKHKKNQNVKSTKKSKFEKKGRHQKK